MRMSKQSIAKIAQNYTPKAAPAYCSNCNHYSSDKEIKQSTWSGDTWDQEKNVRCGIGGFSIKKKGVCDMHIRIAVGAYEKAK